LKCLYQVRRVRGHIFVCYWYCLLLRIFYKILKDVPTVWYFFLVFIVLIEHQIYDIILQRYLMLNWNFHNTSLSI
jgi:CRISPR/Cas system-associated endonuclease Cas3-HD